MIALAIEIRCFCPPDKVIPRSPTTVSKPSGKAMILSYTPAALAASIISCSVNEWFVENAMLFFMVSENKNTSNNQNLEST